MSLPLTCAPMLAESGNGGSQRSSLSSLTASPPLPPPTPAKLRGEEEPEEVREERRGCSPAAAPLSWTCGSSAPPTSAWRLRCTVSDVRGRRWGRERGRRRRQPPSSLTCSSLGLVGEEEVGSWRRGWWEARQTGEGGYKLNNPQTSPSPCPRPLPHPPPPHTLPPSLRSLPLLTGDWLRRKRGGWSL